MLAMAAKKHPRDADLLEDQPVVQSAGAFVARCLIDDLHTWEGLCDDELQSWTKFRRQPGQPSLHARPGTNDSNT